MSTHGIFCCDSTENYSSCAFCFIVPREVDSLFLQLFQPGSIQRLWFEDKLSSAANDIHVYIRIRVDFVKVCVAKYRHGHKAGGELFKSSGSCQNVDVEVDAPFSMFGLLFVNMCWNRVDEAVTWVLMCCGLMISVSLVSLSLAVSSLAFLQF